MINILLLQREITTYLKRKEDEMARIVQEETRHRREIERKVIAFQSLKKRDFNKIFCSVSGAEKGARRSEDWSKVCLSSAEGQTDQTDGEDDGAEQKAGGSTASLCGR